jgi:hypothetical protein
MKINELYVELTRRCNLRCAHCFYGEAQDAMMNNDTLEMTFQAFKEMEWLVVGGPAPLLPRQPYRHPNLYGFLKKRWRDMTDYN